MTTPPDRLQEIIGRTFTGSQFFGSDPHRSCKSDLSYLILQLERAQHKERLMREGLEYYRETRKIDALQAVPSSFKSDACATRALNECDAIDKEGE